MIVNSLLDQDFYKLTTDQFFLHHFPNVSKKYKFFIRNKNIFLSEDFLKLFKLNINHLSTLKYTLDELDWLESLGYFQKDFIEYLKNFEFDPEKEIDIKYNNGTIEVDILNKSQYEIFILEIFSECYNIINNFYYCDVDSKLVNLTNNIHSINIKGISPIIEMGTRRRYSKNYQDTVLDILKKNLKSFIGTSNMQYAYKNNIIPKGTIPHEVLQIGQILNRSEKYTKNDFCFKDFQNYIMYKWLDEYGGKLTLPPTDCITTDVFLERIDKNLATMYNGCREDSGNPFVNGDKIIKFYKNIGIDPMTKTLCFSDSLNFEKCIELEKYFKNRINLIYGIGGYFTNGPVENPLNIVIKLVEVDSLPVAKISNNITKTIHTNNEYFEKIKEEFQI